MADFDAIYEEQELAEPEDLEEAHVQMVPDPIVIRGAGNMTVWVLWGQDWAFAVYSAIASFTTYLVLNLIDNLWC